MATKAKQEHHLAFLINDLRFCKSRVYLTAMVRSYKEEGISDRQLHDAVKAMKDSDRERILQWRKEERELPPYQYKVGDYILYYSDSELVKHFKQGVIVAINKEQVSIRNKSYGSCTYSCPDEIILDLPLNSIIGLDDDVWVLDNGIKRYISVSNYQLSETDDFLIES